MTIEERKKITTDSNFFIETCQQYFMDQIIIRILRRLGFKGKEQINQELDANKYKCFNNTVPFIKR